MQGWLIRNYLESGLRIPGFLLQPAANVGVNLHHRIGLIKGRKTPRIVPESHRIAESSEGLMKAHYDMPAALFENFLGPSMKYSMALWDNGATNLEEAQQAMMEDLCQKAAISDGESILDIGCGFGSFAIHALNAFPTSEVFGLTLSKVQAEYIREKQARPGHPLCSARFRLIEADFNTVQLGRRFDRILSIGVFEHVSNLALALQKIGAMLAPGGKCLLHYIVYFPPLDRMATLPPERNFMTGRIFPGGRIWFCDEVFNFQDDLKIEKSWFLNGSNYRKTVESWTRNLEQNMNSIRHIPGFSESTLKTWELFFRICVAVFALNRGRYYGNAQYLLTHP